MKALYCIDTSGWTGLKRAYPFFNFPTLWKKLQDLVDNGNIVSPQEVYLELEKQEDELFQWAKKNKKIFVKPDIEHVALVTDILKNYPKLINPLKLGPTADPFVIALAVIENRNRAIDGFEFSVVSSETPGGSKKTKIPDVCAAYNMKHLIVVDLICNEGWIF